MNNGHQTKVLVLLAARNGAGSLEAQVNSIIWQKGVAITLWISDDASTDETRDVMTMLAQRHSNIRLFFNEKASGSAGANFRSLIQKYHNENYEYVAFSDQDDIWSDTKLLHACLKLSSSNCLGYSGAVNAIWPNGNAKILKQRGKVKKFDFIFEGAGQGCTFVINADIFSRISEFCREHSVSLSRFHYHDWLVYLLIRTWYGPKWYFDLQPMMDYIQHDSNEIGARKGWAAVSKRFALIKSGWYRSQVCQSIDLFEVSTGNSVAGLACLKIKPTDRSMVARLRVIWVLARHSRRKFQDRLMLIFASLCGYL